MSGAQVHQPRLFRGARHVEHLVDGDVEVGGYRLQHAAMVGPDRL